MKPYYEAPDTTMHVGDVLAVLRELTSESVQCIVTSPPYWGLRDYGTSGQLGLEKTPEEYTSKMVEIFREIRRVLKDDGTLFLNLGDSYFGSGRGPTGYNGIGDQSKRQGFDHAPRVSAYDTHGRAPGDYQGDGCLLRNLCDECQAALLGRKFHKRFQHAHESVSYASVPSQAHKALHYLSPESWDSIRHLLNERLDLSMRDQSHIEGPENGLLPFVQESTIAEFSPQPLASSSQCSNCGEWISEERSFSLCAQVSAHMCDDSLSSFGCSQDSVLLSEEQEHHNQCTGENCLLRVSLAQPPYIQPYCTTNQLKSKDLVGIPWRIAFALQADGWYLRSDIIWSKPNPIPESVTDRPTKAHEYIFLLSKKEKYYYDQEAILEPCTESTFTRIAQDLESQEGSWRANGGAKTNGPMKPVVRKTDKQRGHSRRHAGFNDRWDHMTKAEQAANGRNKRTIWTVATHPFSEAHFATFPEDLIKPCILAGCPEGGIVLDPFGGSGTTAVVSRSLGRKSIYIDLNPKYADMAIKRLEGVALSMAMIL